VADTCSTVQPPAALPHAMPPSRPVTASVMPSLSRPSGVRRWTSVIMVTMVGAVAIPASSSVPATSASDPVRDAASNGSVSSAAIAAMHHGSRDPAGPAGRTAPYSRPAAQEPAAWSASTAPAAVRCPCASANAIVTTSVAPNTPPVARHTASSDGMPGARSGDFAGVRRCTGGSVERWAANSRTPVSSSTAPTRVPASGKNVPHRKAATTGPSMKHSSSTACSKELAVCRASVSSPSRWAQRARDMPPVLGVVAVAA
jgi:hypothetical protein